MRKPFSYYGGKDQLAPIIRGWIPSGMTYYAEPFCGSAAVFFSTRGKLAKNEILNDVNKNITSFFDIVRDDPDKLIRVLSYTPVARDTFARAMRILKAPDHRKINRAWALFVVANLSTQANMRTFCGSTRTARDVPGNFYSKVATIKQVSKRLRGAIIENVDYKTILKKYDTPEAVIYVDPPYLNVISERDMKTAYHHNLMTNQDHEEMVSILKTTRAAVVLSGYDNPIYSALTGWHVEKYEVTARLINHPGTKRTEILWINPYCYEITMKQPGLFAHG